MQSLADRATRVLAGGPGTFSKSPKRYPQGIAPTALVSGEGCYVVGDDGKTYLDTIAALGPILLGYSHTKVTEAVMAQVQHGTSFSMVHPLEVEVAEKLCEVIPCAEMVRFARNGTDVTNMAVRVMRATGRRHMLFIGYHGGACDSYGITTDRHRGILTQLAPYNHQLAWGDLVAFGEVLSRTAHDLAGVMVEVPSRPWGEAPSEISRMLDMYRAYAHKHGGLFCLDEIVTFPRYGLAGAQKMYSVTPDLCCVSKGMANGLPLAALVGKRDYMSRLDSGQIFASWTFAGETTSLAACKATLEVLEETNALSNLWAQGQRYGEGLVKLLADYELPGHAWGNAARLTVKWHDARGMATAQELRTMWMAEHALRGVLIGIGVVFPMTCWQESDVTMLLETAEHVCMLIREALDTHNIKGMLACPVIEDVMAVRA